MSKEQSWESCKYALGDLGIDWAAKDKILPTVKLLRAISSESVGDRLLKEAGVHRFYFCQHPGLVNLAVYNQAGLPEKGDKIRQAAVLFRLNIDGNYSGPTSLDLFGEEKSTLEGIIKDGLRMCTHCKFYKPR